ncbi:MAG: hypothetical protein JRN57_01675 [Nitrososphaerota archaeon]|nr:hypothetical protein [Nitrososphaerota archaeon]
MSLRRLRGGGKADRRGWLAVAAVVLLSASALLLFGAPRAAGASTTVATVGGLGVDSIAIDPTSNVLLAVDGYAPLNGCSPANSANLLGISMPSGNLLFNDSLVSSSNPCGNVGIDFDVSAVSNIAVDPTNGVAYVGVSQWDCSAPPCPVNVDAIKVSTGAVIAAIPVATAEFVAVDPTTHLVFAGGEPSAVSGNVDEISEATNSVVASLNVTAASGAGVSALAVDTANHLVYGFSSAYSQGLVALNESPFSLAYNVSWIGGTGLAVDPGLGLLYIDDSVGPGLNVASTTSHAVVGIGPSASDYIAVNTNTHLVFLASNGENAVEVDTPSGGNLLNVTNLLMNQNASSAAGRSPFGIAVDSTRNLVYVGSNSTVQVLDASSVSVTSTTSESQTTTSASATTTTTSAATSTSQGQSTTGTPSTSGSGGIPQFPFQPLAVIAFTAVLFAAYFAARRRATRHQTFRPVSA